MMTETNFALSEALARAIADMGYEEATPIQAAAIPPLLEGRDVVGQAQTGTGKTAAFGIPLIESIDPALREVQALVLCPTRELALQVAGELNKFARYLRGLSVLPVYGGQPIERQLRGLRAGAHVVVGTPGRVMDHMNRGSLKFDAIKMVVLDEADEMLDMGFRDDIESILSQTPEERQTALFSATMPRAILQLSRRYLRDPLNVTIERRAMTVDAIAQSYFSVRSFHKTELLARLILRDKPSLSLVFMNTKRGVEEVVTDMTRRGFSVAGLHGDMRQVERDAIMSRFRNGLIKVLVATDVAARGLDVDDIEAVFNYDMPQDVEYYVHRIGRTGRAGRKGRAYTFVVGRETTRMWDYRRITGAKILCEQAPNAEEIRRVQAEALMEQVGAVAAGEIGDQAMALADRILETEDVRRSVAALLDIVLGANGAQIDLSVDLTPPEPVRSASSEFRPNRRTGPYGKPAPRAGIGRASGDGHKGGYPSRAPHGGRSSYGRGK